MQYYPQDTAASLPEYGGNDGDKFLSFSVNPDTDPHGDLKWRKFNNDHSNFFWYNQIGNIGFIGFVGASNWEESKSLFERACEYARSRNNSAIPCQWSLLPLLLTS
jgi:hypothetical protein